MTIQEATQTLRRSLESIYDSREAKNIANLVMENLTGLSRVDRLTQKDNRLSEAAMDNFQKYSQQLLEHRPVQYVLGEAWFAGMKFYVDEHVLIPRPETEELVEWVLTEASPHAAILDVGTGSGCIPISLKKKLQDAVVYACDISAQAIAVAKRNALANETGVHFIQADILTTDLDMLPGLDFIVSNPPYIPALEREGMDQHVKSYEPSLALFVPDDNPLLFYKAIARLASVRLNSGGWVFLEIHENMAAEVIRVLNSAGFQQIELKKDMQGRDRMVRGRMFAALG